MQLDRAATRAATDTKLAELLAAVEETTQVNQFLLQFDNMEIAVKSLATNRESMAHAADALARVFDRIIKANTTIPTAALLEQVLAKPPAGAHTLRSRRSCMTVCDEMSRMRSCTIPQFRGHNVYVRVEESVDEVSIVLRGR